MGLEPLEFQRVVLLPQGEFNLFLLSTDEDRERLLRNLFGGQLYERAVEWLKDRVRRLEDEVRGIDVELQHLRLTTVASLKVATAAWQPDADVQRLDAVDDGQLCAAIEELESARAAHQQTLDTVRSELAAVTTRKSVAVELAQRFDAAEAAVRALADLEARRDAVSAARVAAEESRRARPVVQLGDRAEKARQKAMGARQACAEAEAAVASGLNAFGVSLTSLDPAGVAAAVEGLAQRVEAERKALALSADGRARPWSSRRPHSPPPGRQATGLLAAVAAIRSEQAALEASIAELEPLAAQLPERRAEHERAARRRELRTGLAEAVERLVTARSARGSCQGGLRANDGALRRDAGPQACGGPRAGRSVPRLRFDRTSQSRPTD